MLSTVREGKKVHPTCIDCGCRLNVVTIEDMVFAHHFAHNYDGARDAQNHLCISLGKVWPVISKGTTHGAS